MHNLVYNECKLVPIPESQLKIFLNEHYEDQVAIDNMTKLTQCYSLNLINDKNISDIALGITAYKRYSKHTAETRHTIVHTNYRGLGLSKILTAELEHILKFRGIKKLTCRVFANNIPIICHKIKTGWLVEGLLRDHDAPGIHDYIMSKEL